MIDYDPVKAQELEDNIEDVKEEIAEYKKLVKVTVGVATGWVLWFGGWLTAGIVTGLSPGGINLGPGVFIAVVLGIFFGLGTGALLSGKHDDYNYPKLKRRLKAAERASRNYMLRSGLG